MRYEVEIGSFYTRLVTRTIFVEATDENDAKSKAIDEFYEIERQMPNSINAGEPHIDIIEEV